MSIIEEIKRDVRHDEGCERPLLGIFKRWMVERHDWKYSQADIYTWITSGPRYGRITDVRPQQRVCLRCGKRQQSTYEITRFPGNKDVVDFGDFEDMKAAEEDLP